MKNIVAYSLWGDNLMYWEGALKNIQQVKEYFPDWICRFYIDKDSKKQLISSIIGDNVEVILVDSKESFHGMFWRFWASEDEDVNIFLSRDCDSRISNREFMAVKEWLLSDKDFHIMRDHPYHTVPILGGMWGCRNKLMRDIGLSKLIEKWGRYGAKGLDQDFLSQVVYPLVRKNAIEHSEFNINFGEPIRNFPTIRNEYEFVGDVFYENELRDSNFWRIIKNINNNE
jgi:hypothetical protein